MCVLQVLLVLLQMLRVVLHYGQAAAVGGFNHLCVCVCVCVCV